MADNSIFQGHIAPAADNTADLGTSSVRFRRLWKAPRRPAARILRPKLAVISSRSMLLMPAASPSAPTIPTSIMLPSSSSCTKRGISARDLLAEGAQMLGGGAGGKPELAISGGPSADRLDDAIEAVARAAKSALTR